MQRGRIVLVVAGAAGLLALLFPLFTVAAIDDVVGWSGYRLLPAAALAAAAIVALAGDRGEAVSGLPAVATTAGVAVGALAAGAVLIDAILAVRDAEAAGLAAAVGSGMWLTSIAAALGLIAVPLAMSRRLN